MNDFSQFPHTSHLGWVGPGTPPDEKFLAADETAELPAGEAVVEEKLDGANLGVSLAYDGTLRFQYRGHDLHPPFARHFQRVSRWIAAHEHALRSALLPDLILFGEWCAARHSVAYDRLPDWLIVFDAYDRGEHKFFSTARRNALAQRLGLAVVRALWRGRTPPVELMKRLSAEPSHYRAGPIMGFFIRKETPDWLLVRSKLVRPKFVQGIDEHWRRWRIEWNRIEHRNTAEPTGGAREWTSLNAY